MVFTIFATENPNIWLLPTSILSFLRPAFIIPIPWQNSEQLFANISLNTKKATDAVATKWQLCTGARLRRSNSFSVMHQKQKPEEEKFGKTPLIFSPHFWKRFCKWSCNRITLRSSTREDTGGKIESFFPFIYAEAFHWGYKYKESEGKVY